MPTSTDNKRKSLARGGPKSKRKKQSKITELASPVRAVAESVISRSQGSASKHRAVKAGENPRSKRTQSGSEESDDSDMIPLSSQSHTGHSAKSKKRTSKQSKLSFATGGSGYVTRDLDSEEEEFAATQLQTVRDADSIQDRSETRQGSAAISQPRLDVRRKQSAIVIDSDSDDELITPLKRRERFMPTQTPVSEEAAPTRKIKASKSSARDLDGNIIKVGRKRDTAKSARNTFSSHLDRLKRKKLGLASSEEEASGSEHDSPTAWTMTDSEESFIVEDEMEAADYRSELPADFQQPRTPLEQFKIAVQWEILDLLMPQGGVEPDAYFKGAIIWLRDQTQNKSQSATSSIWRRSFLRALQRGPEIHGLETGNLGYFCDACGRQNRVATYVVKFEGRRYDRSTLDDLDSDADSSEDDLHVDDEALSDVELERARQERVMRQEWNLGSSCYERTCVAHELYHLRKHMRIEVHEKLDRMGYFSAAKKYERSTMTRAARLELTNQLTEELDNSHFQKRLWVKFRRVIDEGDNFIVDPGATSRKRSKFVL